MPAVSFRSVVSNLQPRSDETFFRDPRRFNLFSKVLVKFFDRIKKSGMRFCLARNGFLPRDRVEDTEEDEEGEKDVEREMPFGGKCGSKNRN